MHNKPQESLELPQYNRNVYLALEALSVEWSFLHDYFMEWTAGVFVGGKHVDVALEWVEHLPSFYHGLKNLVEHVDTNRFWRKYSRSRISELWRKYLIDYASLHNPSSPEIWIDKVGARRVTTNQRIIELVDSGFEVDRIFRPEQSSDLERYIAENLQDKKPNEDYIILTGDGTGLTSSGSAELWVMTLLVKKK